MKTVFANKDIAPAWVEQTQPEGRNPKQTFYFEGDTIYSYGSHFPIAKFFDAPNGERVVLITTRTSSISTSRHCNYVSRALYTCSLRKIHCAKIVDVKHAHTHTHTHTHTHNHNLNSFHDEFIETGGKHNRARLPHTVEYNGRRIHALLVQTRAYCEVMLIPVPAWAMLPEDIPAGKGLTSAMMVHAAQV